MKLERWKMNDKIKKIVDLIVQDIEDRKGIGDEWQMIDSDITEEIKEEWGNIIKSQIRENQCV